MYFACIKIVMGMSLRYEWHEVGVGDTDWRLKSLARGWRGMC